MVEYKGYLIEAFEEWPRRWFANKICPASDMKIAAGFSWRIPEALKGACRMKT